MNSCNLDGVSETNRSRAERKERTRRALLDGTVALAAERGFAALSLREIARSADIVPTAFYRHFSSLDELGMCVIEEGIRTLRGTLRDLRASTPMDLRRYVRTVFDRVEADRGRHGFLARERHGGSLAVRMTIEAGLALISRELAVDLSRTTERDIWATDDLEMVAELLVATMAERIAVYVETTPDGTELVIARTEQLIRLIILGMDAWKPRPDNTRRTA